MNVMILTFKIVQTLFNMIRKFQIKIVKFKISQIIIFIFSHNDNMNSLFILKSEKFSDSFIFNND